jgi:hypothetical protein
MRTDIRYIAMLPMNQCFCRTAVRSWCWHLDRVHVIGMAGVVWSECVLPAATPLHFILLGQTMALPAGGGAVGRCAQQPLHRYK